VAAYLIGQVIVHDAERFAPYVAQTSALIARYGGEVLDVVRAVEAVEGNWPIGALTALVRFPDEASLRVLGLAGECCDEGSPARIGDEQCRAMPLAAASKAAITSEDLNDTDSQSRLP
jgi:uncharacterized protein (DUF1330 family)